MMNNEENNINEIIIPENAIYKEILGFVLLLLGIFLTISIFGMLIGIPLVIIGFKILSKKEKCPSCSSKLQTNAHNKMACPSCNKEYSITRKDPSPIGCGVLVLVLFIGGMMLFNYESKREEKIRKENTVHLSPEKAHIENLKSNILSVSTDIDSIDFIKSKKTGKYSVKVRYKHDPLGFGGTDWNNISILAFDVSKKVFQYAENEKLEITVFSLNNNGMDYAVVKVDKQHLPADFNNYTYHEFFANINPISLSKQSQNWLCEYYKSYSSARPYGELPRICGY